MYMGLDDSHNEFMALRRQPFADAELRSSLASRIAKRFRERILCSRLFRADEAPLELPFHPCREWRGPEDICMHRNLQTARERSYLHVRGDVVGTEREVDRVQCVVIL
jgi:hypothetical protein